MGLSGYREVAEFFKVLSHPVRVMIVDELLKRKRCVNDIKELIKVRQPNISQHLAILKLHDIVDCGQEGKKKCYCLKNPQFIKEILSLMRRHKLI